MGVSTLKHLSITLGHLAFEGAEYKYGSFKYGMENTVVLNFCSHDNRSRLSVELPLTDELHPENIDKIKNQYFTMDLNTPIA